MKLIKRLKRRIAFRHTYKYHFSRHEINGARFILRHKDLGMFMILDDGTIWSLCNSGTQKLPDSPNLKKFLKAHGIVY